jgi:16S rRNA (cytosine967-C5)-methyltransferase
LGGIALDAAIVIEDPIPVSQIPGFDDGLVSVQDAGAQLAAKLLSPQAGEYILDACAAPGGKTTHLAELMGSGSYQLLALEIDAERLKKVEGAIERMGLPKHTIRLVQGSASRQDWWDGQAFDKILCDVPCSASGIVRRHPDIVFLRRKEDIAAVIKVQRAILENAWRMLKPGGSLLYVTCSVFPQEGEEQIAWFVSQHPNALRLSAPGQLLPNLNNDGFFYGLLSKDQEQSN